VEAPVKALAAQHPNPVLRTILVPLAPEEMAAAEVRSIAERKVETNRKRRFSPEILKTLSGSNRDLSLGRFSRGAAKRARLAYVSDRQMGIGRNGRARTFLYRDHRGLRITDAAVLARISSLAVPPAWTDVWICRRPNGHIQATGRDARGRKQYRYHPRWRQVRDETKYHHIVEFARVLPVIQRHVQTDLKLRGLPREKVIAAVVKLMELTLARVGNTEYAHNNHSFGLTTLRNRHVRIRGGSIELDFSAKSNLEHHSVVSDRKLARIVKNCRDLPGSELFQFIDGDGRRHRVDSGDLNEYLRMASGLEISAKDFRTWAATNLAIREFATLEDLRPSKKGELIVIRKVAERLRNTPAVCRRCYIHPEAISAYHRGAFAKMKERCRSADIWRVEPRFLSLLANGSNGRLPKVKRFTPSR
jgi:DNA topoisomerase I